MDLKTRLTSRKLWVSLIAAFVAFGNSYFDWGLDAEKIWAIVLPLMGFVLAEGTVDTVREMKK